jgi:hypothetical protein
MWWVLISLAVVTGITFLITAVYYFIKY